MTAARFPEVRESDVDSDVNEQPVLLIVDDVSDNRAILTRRFQRRGYSILEADCGKAALDVIAASKVDLVLLDIMMPDMNGIEVLEHIRRDHSAALMPVIMVTAKTQSEDVVEALNMGANDYVTKPVDFPVALARVTAQIARRNAELALRKANIALNAANESLEKRVSERTAKLTEANESLRNEMVQRRRVEEKIEYLAHHDALTGLTNRSLFDEQLRVTMNDVERSNLQMAVLFLDLDGFKSVNDALGHSVGDALLKQIANCLRDEIAPSDILARLGGDEFGIIHVSNDVQTSAAKLSRRLVEAVAECQFVEGHHVVIGVSIGIALDGDCDGDNNPSSLVKMADVAMYRAKTDGRGTYRFFKSEMDAEIRARRELELDLRKALNQGDFEVYYQPIYNMQERTIAGFEALLRWKHATRGFISPAEFIPLAEETGLIVPIGEWVLRQACSEASTWPRNLKIAVNLSPLQFRKKNLVALVISALSTCGLRPERLELEITEAVLLVNNESNLETLRQLRDLGVRISMDDFGTGYSSLSYLRSFQFDKIKIDQSFVRDMSDQDESRAIVRAVTGLGKSFGIMTTAEGVETRKQLEYLMLEGCTEVQGYLMSKPRPAAEARTLIDENLSL